MLDFAVRSLSLPRVRSWPPQRVQELQNKRLRSLLLWCTRQSSFYRRRFRGLNLETVPLAELPPTNKNELMADFDRVVTDPAIHREDLESFVDNPENEGKWFRGEYAVSHTSGSQGQPLLMVCDQRHIELLFSLQMTRGNVRKPSPIEAARRLLQPARLAVVTLKKGFYPSASAFEYMPPVVRRFMKVLRLSQTDPDLIEQLHAFQPTAITAYASVLEMLALEIETGRLRLGPQLVQVTNNSEVLTEKARARIEAAFGCPLLNNYATGECPFLTNGCPTHEGAHLNADWAILEVVDDQYRPVPPGTPGQKVLLTNLANRVQPFIRYEIGDVVTMAATPCGCGSLLPRIEKIEGRSADTFWIRDGSTYRQIINSVFKNAFDYTREVREWQAVQIERNRIHLQVELLPGTTLNEPHAWWSINRQLELYNFLGKLDVSLQVVPRLRSDQPSGKFRRMISLVGPPENLSDSTTSPPRHRFDHANPPHPPHAREHNHPQPKQT